MAQRFSTRTPADSANGRRLLIRAGVSAVLVVAIIITIFAALVPYARYETTHDIPNPWWGVFNGEYSYTPEQGPPSAELMVTRPETIVARYLSDYLRLAGTYPCIRDTNRYDNGGDPVFSGQPCPVIHPVESYRVTKVTVLRHGLLGYPEAVVDVTILYTDGAQYETSFHLIASLHKQYYIAFTHMDCWGFGDGDRLYNRVVSDVPKGAEFFDKATNKLKCQS